MNEKLQERYNKLIEELEQLVSERNMLRQRQEDIDIRVHQVAGAISEFQALMLDLDHQHEQVESTLPEQPESSQG